MSIIAFALSGVYAIVDGYFVGNTIGDAGLSAINIAYPIVALIQAVGTALATIIGQGVTFVFALLYFVLKPLEPDSKKCPRC